METSRDQHAFCSVYAHVVRFGSLLMTPCSVDWVSAQACPLDKKNGKEGCEAVRLINIVEEMGNSFVGTLLERGIRGRSALAMCVWISTWPISSRGYHSSKGHCSSGACELGATSRSPARMSRMHLRAQGTINKMHVWVLGFAIVTCASAQQSYRDARVVLQCVDGELVVKPGCGVLQGTTGQWIFQDVYHPALDSWLQLVESPDFLVRDPVSGENFGPIHRLQCRRCGQGQTFQRWARSPAAGSCGGHGLL